VVGPLPADIQMVTPFVAGIPTNASHAEAGSAVIGFLITPEAKRVLKAKGLEPA
jgi:molybdate transport system substrate-binding protein